MAGTVVMSTLSDGTNSTSATNCIQGSARAWVNFNGTGTVAIRSSYNVSSITDNGTGDYTVNFTNAMPNTNYATQLTSGWTPGVDNSSFSGVRVNGVATGSLRFSNVNNSDAAYDSASLSVTVFTS
jgi:hypothetical protein